MSVVKNHIKLACSLCSNKWVLEYDRGINWRSLRSKCQQCGAANQHLYETELQ